MPKNPNAPGGSNRQGPKVKSQGKRGPITGNSGPAAPSQKPWSLNQGTNGSTKGKVSPGKPQK